MAKIAGMAGRTAGSAVPVGRARTLAEVYQHLGEVDAADIAAVRRRSHRPGSDPARRCAPSTAPHAAQPEVILAALRDLALAGRAAWQQPYALGTATLPLARRSRCCCR